MGLDADLAAVRTVSSDCMSGVGFVGARWLLPEADARLGVWTGRHLAGDWGWGVDISRFFADTQLALTVKDSQHGEKGVFALSADFLLDQTPAFDPAEPEHLPDFVFDPSLPNACGPSCTRP